MVNNENSTSSSDDETDVNAFREACDETFLPQSLFTSKDSSNTDTKCEEEKKEVKPSLRVTERADNFESFGVSQSFKNYVAKKLEAMLEKNISDEDAPNSKNDIPKKKRKKKHRKEENGIKLLSSSDEIITNIQNDLEQKSVAKRQECTSVNDTVNKKKCKQVAVDSDWILSKKETEAWSEKSKGSVFKYKRDHNGMLIEHS